jgi:hypothetical protein
MKTFTNWVLALLLGFCAVAPAAAQTALNETTVATLMTATQSNIVLASATGIADNYVIYVDKEAMIVSSSWSSGVTVPVIRGALGTVATSHAVGVLVYIGPPVAFIGADRAGQCTSTNERYLPQINLVNGSIWDCSSTVEKWVNLRERIAVTCRALLIADMIDQSCFIADRQYLVTKITYIHTTPESAGTLTVIPRRQQSTEAAASGDALATAINAVAAGTAAQTLVTATLTSSEALLILEAGDRLGLDFTDDSAGELAGVTVTFYLIPL